MEVLIPDTVPDEIDVPTNWTATRVSAAEPIPVDHRNAEAIVVWGCGDSYVRSAAEHMPRLRLVQSLSAGVERLLVAGFGPDVTIASGRGLHDMPVAEHIMALTLSLVRSVPRSIEAKREHRWAHELGGIQPLRTEKRLTTLIGARVCILGFGSIGRHVAGIFRQFQSEVYGVARSPRRVGEIEVVSFEDFRNRLPNTDVLVNVLPDTADTRLLVDSAVFTALPKRAIFVNVGRGSTVDQNALAQALREGSLGGAAIDVTSPEPLPASHELWLAPNLIITPHAAGGRPLGISDRIRQNLLAISRGTPVIEAA